MDFLNFIEDNINFREKNFLEAIVLTLISMISLSLLPHLQYKYKLLTRITNNDMGRAADGLAIILIHIGTFKNYAFFEALFTNKRFDLPEMYAYPIFIFGILLIIMGFVFVVFSFNKLGLRGMYFGDHFGFLLSQRIDQFPYNCLNNPSYQGCNMIYFGLSLTFRSLTGIVLTLFIMLMSEIFWYSIESKKLDEFYPSYESDDSTSDSEGKKKNK